MVYAADRQSGFGLASQEPWIQHASVRDNILFGKDYDPGFYQAVIEACAFCDDLNVSLSVCLFVLLNPETSFTPGPGGFNLPYLIIYITKYKNLFMCL